jgi:hypothetical protein
MVANVFTKSLFKGKHYNYMTSFALFLYLEESNLVTPTSLLRAFITCVEDIPRFYNEPQSFVIIVLHTFDHIIGSQLKSNILFPNFYLILLPHFSFLKLEILHEGVHLHLLKGFMDQISVTFNLTTRQATCQSFSFLLKTCKCKVWCNTFNFVKNHILNFHWEVQ